MARPTLLGQGDLWWPGPFRDRPPRFPAETAASERGRRRGPWDGRPRLVVDLNGLVERKSDVVWSHSHHPARVGPTAPVVPQGATQSRRTGPSALTLDAGIPTYRDF